MLTALIIFAARGSQEEGPGPRNKVLVSMVRAFRQRRSILIGKVKGRDVFFGDLEAYDLYVQAFDIAQHLRAKEIDEATAMDAIRAVQIDLDTKTDPIKVVVAEDEDAPETLYDAIRIAQGPKQYADMLLKAASPLDGHTRKAIEILLKEDREFVLQNLRHDLDVFPRRSRPGVMKYIFGILNIFRVEECRSAIIAAFGKIRGEDAEAQTSVLRP